MKFFEAVPSELFSPLASPNRILYADALDVLYAAYQENLKIREDVLYSMLRTVRPVHPHIKYGWAKPAARKVRLDALQKTS